MDSQLSKQTSQPKKNSSWGSCPSTWLARNLRDKKYVALKVYIHSLVFHRERCTLGHGIITDQCVQPCIRYAGNPMPGIEEADICGFLKQYDMSARWTSDCERIEELPNILSPWMDT
ncbi:uncharacterized protein N7518_006995 [Penicillium psychrosexuale]|uniref:uncharacterized protein n=1 Tax=Penicillium psychrosexuale TaxID=1002107 RepID=UPI002545285E|nr:uncharacterized protein N7518_006995 [Penicillium psychrosexuale]KAJ5789984.1 hypothetical protein N7518_006995 [Penicillium psychrosexuale]